MRTLIIIPIIHTEQDMGSLLERVREEYIARYGQAKWEEHRQTLDEVWRAVRQAIEALDLPYASARLYQDGLPDCGREPEIIREVAAQGSRNHQLLLDLMQKGVCLMGTEDPRLLVEEYRLLKGALQESQGGGPADRTAEERSRALLAERDRYIASRINRTLLPGEIGLLFLGLAHSVEPLLDADILVRPLLPLPQRPTADAEPA